MKILRQGVALAVMGAGLAAIPQTPAVAAPPAPDKPIVQQMRDEAAGGTTVSRSEATGKVGFIRTGRNGDLLPDSDAGPGTKAKAYLARYAPAFGARAAELTQSDVSTDRYGTTVTYTQEYRGVPVFGSMIRAHVDTDGDLTSVNGFAAPNLSMSVDPRFGAGEIGKRAVTWVKLDPPGAHDGHEAPSTRGLSADADLVIYRQGSTKAERGESVLAYAVEVSNRASIRDMLFFDAQTGKILNRYSLVHGALEREIYESSPAEEDKVFDEGDGDDPATLNENQRNIYEGSGESYWFFQNAFGRDSYDGAGATMKIVNNDPTINCPNANWNGQTTNYCNGVTSDDVVAHEWGHAFTEYTWGGIYQWQPGALNEAYSDIWGETVDLINARQDEDEGDLTATRGDGQCSTRTAASPVVTINAPADIARECLTGGASFGEQLDGTGITGDVVAPTDVDEDGDAAGATTLDGCSTYDQDVTGQVVLVNRGFCAFSAKAEVATDAGAAALIIGNRDDAPIGMSGSGAGLVPTVSIGLGDREAIRSSLGEGDTVNVTMRDAAGDRDDSYRWLIGEDASAFGGAIRDMWTPTCLGDPGKVTDAEYKCSTDDSGGVHSNSGVPNHGFALAVDGGTYNGYDIAGLGLTKAAAVYYRAMTSYQTPTSGFSEHADALDAACADLVGQPINELSTDAEDATVSDEVLSAADCATFGAVANAVELRTEPTQCGFTPLLAPGSPSLCAGAGRGAEAVYAEDFEDGLDGLVAEQELTELPDFGYYGGFGAPWEADSDLPGDREGSAAYGPAPSRGQCTGDGDTDFSSRDSIITPIVEMPDYTLRNPVLSFEHFVATEVGYDGGNVKVRVNGGDWEVVPAAAYLFNAPTEILTLGQGNTNPLEGEAGFTGTDGGEVTGSWGTSQVDLSMLGIVAGDQVELRFDIGRDGCGGVDGWYVDDVEITLCKITADVTATHLPEPATYGDRSSVEVSVDPASANGIATGDVVLRDADGTRLGRAALDEGSVVFDLPRLLGVGTRTVSATYLGSEDYARSTGETSVTIERASSRTRAYARNAVKRGNPLRTYVYVRPSRLSAEGPVVVRQGKRVFGRGQMEDGRLRLRVGTKRLEPGRRTLAVRYRGSDNIEPSRTTITVRIKRR